VFSQVLTITSLFDTGCTNLWTSGKVLEIRWGTAGLAKEYDKHPELGIGKPI